MSLNSCLENQVTEKIAYLFAFKVYREKLTFFKRNSQENTLSHSQATYKLQEKKEMAKGNVWRFTDIMPSLSTFRIWLFSALPRGSGSREGHHLLFDLIPTFKSLTWGSLVVLVFWKTANNLSVLTFSLIGIAYTFTLPHFPLTLFRVQNSCHSLYN